PARAKGKLRDRACARGVTTPIADRLAHPAGAGWHAVQPGRPVVVSVFKPHGREDSMARYLLIAHQTAECDEPHDAASDVAREDPDAEFVVLVPATPVGSLLVWEEGETNQVAQQRAAAARRHLEARGLR